ncbi:SYT4 [Lepeophtheirus salmonis]|uniref:SYT4 n=1 Tax=Lepeophtheirus salmonis TaxID=72036 RepID=A0A7R8CS73_LEPSM|nr:SYT4 [Lepeophtheirus salmonis]CAF2914184.1 SYT4 [Lepeophtheirus salmonis]
MQPEDYTLNKQPWSEGGNIGAKNANLTVFSEVNETYSRSRSASIISEIGNGGPIGISDVSGPLGNLLFSMKYNFHKTALIVTVNKCINLPAKDTAAKSSDPYVKLQLLPEKQHKVKTRVLRKTLNPVYDEDFTFYGINFNQLSTLTLHFVILSFDRYSRDDVIGEVMLNLESYDLSQTDNNPLLFKQEITPRSLKLKSQGRGELLVSLCYQPSSHRITVVVLKARNLPKMDITGLSDPYVKIYLLHNDQRIAKKKTIVKKRTLNPVFNQNFAFELPTFDEGEHGGIKNISLEFLLLDWDRVTKNEVIGRLELGGSNCNGSALQHWNEVISSPRRQLRNGIN